MKISYRGSAIPPSNNNQQKAPDSGGARGALSDEVLSNIIADNERVRAAFVSGDGLTRIAGEEQRHVSFTVVMAVTDRRILFVAGDSASGEIGTDAGSLGYDELAAVGVEGSNPAILALSMANGVRWEVPLPTADSDTVDSIVRHLHWVGKLRARTVACRNDVELAAGEIREHAAAMNWRDAEETYDEARSRLDELITAVQLTEPIEDETIAPELTEMERTLEQSYARLFVERAESQLELGQQLVENQDYEQAQPVLRTAYGQYERAKDRADVIKRADEFQFGEHRELLDDLDRLQWNIETVAAEPIRQAHEAKIMAVNADDPETTLDSWETAFQRYRNVQSLELGTEDRYFTGNPEKVRQELHNAADQLIDAHRRLAREKWHDARDAHDEGDTKRALQTGEEAHDHVEQAGELAAEFQPKFAQELESRRQEIEGELDELRESGTVEKPSDGSETDEEIEGDIEPTTAESRAGEEHLGAADTLAQMDTHHDITLNTSIDGQTADGGRHQEPFGDQGNKETEAETEDEALVGPQRADAEDGEQVVSTDNIDGE